MLREVVILLCAVSISTSLAHSQGANTKNERKQYTREHSAPVPSKTVYEEHQLTKSHPQTSAASPTVATYQYSTPPQDSYLPTQQSSYEVKPTVAKTLTVVEPDVSKSASAVKYYGSANTNHQAGVFAVNEALYPAYPTTQYVNVPVEATYDPNTELARPYYAVPVAPQTVTIESNGASNVQIPSAYTNQQGSEVTYADNAATVRPYYAVPVAANTVSIESHEAVTAHPPAAYATYSAAPAITYVSNAVPVKKYYNVPVAAKTVSVEPHGAVTAQPPTAYATYDAAPAVTYVNNAVPVRQYYTVPVASRTVAVDSHASHAESAAIYPVNQVKTIVTQPAPHYATSGIRYVINPAVKTVATSVPVGSKTVTVEAHSAVTAHPPTEPKYEFVRYHYSPASVPKPIPVPVVYAQSVETRHPSVPQFTVAPTAATYEAKVQVHPTPVPVEYSSARPNGALRYHSVPVPVVHAKSFVEKVYAPIGPTPTPLTHVDHEHGYARAAAYSPASAVSRVSFNGLGVSYGW